MKTGSIYICFSVILFSLAVVANENQDLPGGQCFKCHLDLESEATELWPHDVHAAAGIGCEGCHGGDPSSDDMDKSMSKEAGFVGIPDRKDIPEFCGKCHSSASYMKQYSPLVPVDQVEKYWTSQHGSLLKKGDGKVAQCASCHGAHGIRKVNDAKSPVYASNLPKMCAGCHSDKDYMAEYGIPTDQYEDYVASVHGKALLEEGDVRGAPACNDCHGNHGATPPGLHSVANICGSCHAHNTELFLKSPMAEPLGDKALGECAACHGNHKIIHAKDSWVGIHEESTCGECHSKGDKGADLALYFSNSMDEIQTQATQVKEMVHTAENKGMNVEEAQAAIQEARQAWIQARTEIHAFQKPPVEEKFTKAEENIEKAKTLATVALEEFDTRRFGLAVSTIFLLLLTVGLIGLIRYVDDQSKNKPQ